MTTIDGNILDGVSATPHTMPSVAAAHDIALPPGRGLFRLLFWPPLDRVKSYRRNRPGLTLLEFGR
jgi:hypothetical protein